jgi:uncharacterized membrane protein
MTFKAVVEFVGKSVDAAGVVVMIAGVLIVACGALSRMQRAPSTANYRQFRQGIGKAILLGLELLVAGDIIRTVAVSPTFRSAGVLAIIVAIRTFLSISLEVELEGHWPWQKSKGRQEGNPVARAHPPGPLASSSSESRQ